MVSERRGFNEIENSCVDCVDQDGSRIQEKICFVHKSTTGFELNLKNLVVGILNLRKLKDLIMRMILIY